MDDLILGEKILYEDVECIQEDEMDFLLEQNCLVIDFDNLIDAKMENDFIHNNLLEMDFPYLLTDDDIKIATASNPS